MDDKRFDALTQKLWLSVSRRHVLDRIAAIGIIGASAGLFSSLEESEAKRPGKNRRKHHKRHSGRRKDNRKGKRKKKDGASATCRNLDQLCSVFGGPSCCAGTTCEVTAPLPFITTCQRGCDSTSQCEQWFPGKDVECVVDLVACPSHPSGCCRPKRCHPERRQTYQPFHNNSRDTATCKHGNGICCGNNAELQVQHCCFPGQVCLAGGGCVDNDLDLIRTFVDKQDDARFCQKCTVESGTACCGSSGRNKCCPADTFCNSSMKDVCVT